DRTVTGVQTCALPIYTVTKPGPVEPATVVLRTTADTPVAGTPPAPVTCRSSTPPRSGVGPPRSIRVSARRAGVRPWNSPADGAAVAVVENHPAVSAIRWAAADE